MCPFAFAVLICFYPSSAPLPAPPLLQLGLREIEDSLQIAQRQDDARQLQVEIEEKERQLSSKGFDGYEQ